MTSSSGSRGETAEDFAATVELVRRIEYQQVFVFKYSPRPGTAADRRLADNIPLETKAARNNELLAVQMEIMERHKRTLIGQSVEVLVEGYSKAARRVQQESAADASSSKADQLIGRTPHRA